MINNFTYSFAALLLLLSYILLLSRAKSSPRVFPKNPALIAQSSSDINSLRSMIQQRVDYVNCRRSFLNPVNTNILTKIKGLVDTCSINNIPALMELLPGNMLGFLPLLPICKSQNAVLFQFEQGRIGWYFGYLTFPDTNSSFFYELNRIELLPRSEREKYYALGQSTIYNVQIGVGINGNYYRNVYHTAGGTYAISDSETFNFATNDNTFTMTHAKQTDGTYVMTVGFSLPMEALDKDAGTITPMTGLFTINSPIPISPDGKNYCQPCIAGAGTLYGSYTDLSGTGTVNIQSATPQTVSFTNGIGWMDHQWGGSEPNSVFGKLLWNIIGKGKTIHQLPPYVWINLHLPDKQYMIWSFLSSAPTLGQTLEANFNRYLSTGEDWFQSGAKITSLTTVVFNDITFTTSWRIDIDGNTYTLDNQGFGTSIVTDINGVDHWVGCSRILDSSGKQIGTGFMEEDHFMNDEAYINQLWKQAGSGETNLSSWTDKQKDTFTWIGSITGCLILVLVLLLYLILTVRTGITAWNERSKY